MMNGRRHHGIRRIAIAAIQRLPLRRCFALVVAVQFAVVGCASTAPPQDLSQGKARISVEQARSELGTLGVATADRMASVSLGRPLTRGQAAAQGAQLGFLGPLYIGFQLGPGGILFGILIAPVSTVVGTIYGAVRGKSPKQIEEAVQILETAGKATTVQSYLRDLVVDQLGHKGFGEIRTLGAADITQAPVDTVIEVWISDVILVGDATFVGEPAINPKLGLELSGGMRLVRGGVELQYAGLTGAGEKRTLIEWADDDGKTFREQIAKVSAQMAQAVVDTLLSSSTQRTEPARQD